VILVTGPTQQTLQHERLQLIAIESATEMLQAVQQHWKSADIGIFAAAVADYRPAEMMPQKIKKNDEEMVLRLVKNPDVLQWAGANKRADQYLMGFALETNDAVENARGKLQRKNLDFIVVNTLEVKGAGFGGETNQISIIDRNNNLISFELKSKTLVAQDIVNFLKDNTTV
jgi:phosphopantothenoylcysteine decarboxylase/phosphopantothenate--cysteine ligase